MAAPRAKNILTLKKKEVPFSYNNPLWLKSHVSFFNQLAVSKDVDLKKVNPKIGSMFFSYRELIVSGRSEHSNVMSRSENLSSSIPDSEFENLEKNEKKLDDMKNELSSHFKISN